MIRLDINRDEMRSGKIRSGETRRCEIRWDNEIRLDKLRFAR